jgi:xylulokinase
MFLGVDCGTQGTKVVICDTETNRVVGSGYCKHGLISNENGRREQHVSWWIDALKSAISQSVKQSGVDLSKIKAIGVSGQQHGMVVLDDQDTPLYPAKLWCDTESSGENEDIIQAMGGSKSFIDKIGVQLQTGYTASKILWLQRNYPERYQKIAKIMLPHDYINYWLTGNFVSEFGDASGTGYMNIVTRCYDTDVFSVVAEGLSAESVLPKLVSAEKIVGTLTKVAAEELGLNDTVMVSSGGGDNMMGAIGTGNISPGIVTMSLGTSGTLYAYSDTPMSNDNGMIASFCSSSNGWLPLICTMNVTASTTLMQNLFATDLDSFTQSLKVTSPGADGISMLPFFNGERIPPLPDASASINGLTIENMTQSNLIRATTEAATFTLRYGLDMFREQGVNPKEIRLIGGGSKNPIWRQMVSDIMNTPVICPIEHEAAALGSAIQAMWAYNIKNGINVSLNSLCDVWVCLDESTAINPILANISKYEKSYQRYRTHLDQLYGF